MSRILFIASLLSLILRGIHCAEENSDVASAVAGWTIPSTCLSFSLTAVMAIQSFMVALGGDIVQYVLSLVTTLIQYSMDIYKHRNNWFLSAFILMSFLPLYTFPLADVLASTFSHDIVALPIFGRFVSLALKFSVVNLIFKGYTRIGWFTDFSPESCYLQDASVNYKIALQKPLLVLAALLYTVYFFIPSSVTLFILIEILAQYGFFCALYSATKKKKLL